MAIPEGLYGRIAPRSVLAFKHNIDIGAGVIDPVFRGKIKVFLINSSQKKFSVKKGDRITQMIFEKCAMPAMRFFFKLPTTSRGDRGFGSAEPTHTKLAHVIPSDEQEHGDSTQEAPTSPTKKPPDKVPHVIPATDSKFTTDERQQEKEPTPVSEACSHALPLI
eukprot:14065589-Ditylum_brightwellii.AAC.1